MTNKYNHEHAVNHANAIVNVEMYFETLGHNNIVRSQYSDDGVENQLLKVLPKPRSQNEYFDEIESDILISEEDRKKPPEERWQLIGKLDGFRIGREFGPVIELMVSDAIIKGYKLSVRNSPGSIYFYDKIQGDTAAFLLSGVSGGGKTTALMQTMYKYPKCIRHICPDSTMVQVPYIKVEAPTQGSLKTFYDSCIDELSRAIDSELPIKASGSADTKREYFVKQAKRFNLGLLIIDEMQNVLGKKYWNLVDHFLTLSNELMVPIVFVGTPEIIEYFKNNCFRLKRRAGTEILVQPYEKGVLWDSLMEILWQNQWLSEYIGLTQEFKDVFYEETGGVIDRVVKLFKNAQRSAILSGRDTKASFTPQYIRTISKRCFSTSREGLNLLADPNFANDLIKESDLSISTADNTRAIKNAAKNIEAAHNEAVAILTDGKNTANKVELTLMKEHVLTNVNQYCKHCPENFTEYEVEDAMKMVFRNKRKVKETEEELTSKVIKLLYDLRFGTSKSSEMDILDFPIAKKGEL